MGVIQKLYYEQKYSVKMPLICCGCYANMKSGDYKKQARKKMLIMGGMAVLAIAVFCCYFVGIFVESGWGILFGAAFATFWGYYTYVYARRVVMMHQGTKRYEALQAQIGDLGK
jgi:cobalamin biosynthesis protein CobD/CbiB